MSPPALSRLRELTVRTATELSDPDAVRRRLDSLGPDATVPARRGLAHGPLAVALLFSELHLAGVPGTWDVPARTWSRSAFRASASGGPLTSGLMEGAAGYAAVLLSLVRWEPANARALRRFLDLVADQVLASPSPRGRPVVPYDYDLLYGVAGNAQVLLAAERGGWGGPRVARALSRACEDLVHLAGFDGDVPRARVTAQVAARLPFPPRWRGTYVDLGMAHGVPGVLTALSRFVDSARGTPRVRETTARLAWWLDGLGADGRRGRGWPHAHCVDDLVGDRRVASRIAWCYGTPGVALALHRAGSALGDGELRRRAQAVVTSLPGRVRDDSSLLISPTICHGHAGVALSAALAGSGGLAGALADACDSMTGPLGVVDRERDRPRRHDIGFVSGASGVALAALRLSGSPVRLLDEGVLLG